MNLLRHKDDGFGNHRIKQITILGMMLGLTLLLHYLTKWFQWPLATFLKFDFSLLPSIITLFVLGFHFSVFLLIFRFGFEIALSHDGIVYWYGPTMQFMVAIIALFIIWFSYKYVLGFLNENMRLITSLYLMAILSTLIACLQNWSWSTPLYVNLLINDHHSAIDPFTFNDGNYNIPFVKGLLGGWPSWHIAAFGTFAPFNAIKFGTMAIISFPLIKVTFKIFGKDFKDYWLTDHHVHIGWDNRKENEKHLIEEARKHKIRVVGVSASVNDMDYTVKLAKKHNIKFGLGLSPGAGKFLVDEALAKMEQYKDVMNFVGEIGLDYEYSDVPKAEQVKAFKKQMEFAKRNNFGVNIHTKGKSLDDALKIIKDMKFKNEVILHNYNGDIKQTKKALTFNNIYFSIGNQAFYHDYLYVEKSIEIIPAKRLVLETDSPGFPTVERLGIDHFDRQNSTNIFYVLDRVSRIKGMSKTDLLAEMDHC